MGGSNLEATMAPEFGTVAKIAEHVKLSASERETLHQVYVFVEEFFQNPKFDASHDFAHVKRVTSNTIAIFDEEQSKSPRLSPMIVLLGALLHDVEDKKYIGSTAPSESAIEGILLSCGFAGDYVSNIRQLIEGVSYSSEIKNPARVGRLVEEIPELAIVQDADRLDAIGAIGIARCFTFGGAKNVRSIDDSVQHFRDKLLRLEGMMKTDAGRRMAAARTQRLRQFLDWWEEEASVQAMS